MSVLLNAALYVHYELLFIAGLFLFRSHFKPQLITYILKDTIPPLLINVFSHPSILSFSQ